MAIKEWKPEFSNSNEVAPEQPSNLKVEESKNTQETWKPNQFNKGDIASIHGTVKETIPTELKKSFKNSPEWETMLKDYELGKDAYGNKYDAIQDWIDRRPWELKPETFNHHLNYKDNGLKDDSYNQKALARATFLNKYKDLLSKEINYDTKRNEDYKNFLESPEFKNYRLSKLLSKEDLYKNSLQDELQKMFNNKYGYDPNEKAYFHDFDYGEIDQGKRNGFRSTLNMNNPEDERKYFEFLDNLPVDKKKSLKRLIGNGDIDIDDLINYLTRNK